MNQSNTILLLTNRGMGSGPQDLQLTLLKKYLDLLLQQGDLPAVLCFYTEAVKLVIEGSPVLEQLRTLEAKGVRLVICSTCLGYFGLTEQVKVGIVGSMADILEAQLKAGKVITL